MMRLDPAGCVRGQEGNHIRDVVRFANPLQCLHSKREITTGPRFGEVRHVRINHTRRNGIHADATRPQNRGEMFSEGLDGIPTC
jgi:hypothetical protein